MDCPQCAHGSWSLPWKQYSTQSLRWAKHKTGPRAQRYSGAAGVDERLHCDVRQSDGQSDRGWTCATDRWECKSICKWNSASGSVQRQRWQYCVCSSG